MQVVILTPEELQGVVNNAANRAVEKFSEAQPTKIMQISFVDTKEYGKETGKHPITIRRWIHKGYIKGYKVGGRLMIDREEANAVIRGKSVINP